MRILVSLLLVIFTSVVAHAADTGREAVVAAKTRLDQAFQDRDRSTIEAMMTPDHVAVTTYYGGGRISVLAGLNLLACTTESDEWLALRMHFL